MKPLRITLLALAAAAVATGCAAPGAGLRQDGAQAARPLLDPELMYRFGRMLQGQGRDEQALAAYRHVLAARPGHVDALNAVGAIHSMRGEAAQAEEAFRAALQSDPQSARTHNNLGYHLLSTGRTDEAIAVLQRAGALAPRDEGIQANLARAREQAQPTIASGAAAASSAAPAAPAAQPAPAATQITEVLPASAQAAAAAPRSVSVVELQVAAAPAAAPAVTRGLAPGVAPEVAPAPKALPGGFRFEVSNGNGATGLARRTAELLGLAGGTRVRLTNATPYGAQASRIEYVPGAEQAAQALGERLPLPMPLAQVPRLERGVAVRVLLGKDFPRNPQPAESVARLD